MDLPTPDNVRAVLGSELAGEPFSVAAIVLQVDGVRREAWSGETELAVPLFESYPRGQVPPPELTAEPRAHKIIDDTGKTETRRCSTCGIRPGFAPCAVCVGTGAGQETIDRCFACGGEGFLKCSACEGTARVVACTIRYVNDEPVRIRRTFVPAVHPSIRPYIEAKIDPAATWSDDLVFDPEPGLVGSAYRGAAAVRATEDYRGFFFGDVLASCLEGRGEATTGLARFVARTYAVPILWTVFNNQHKAYFYDDHGAFQIVG